MGGGRWWNPAVAGALLAAAVLAGCASPPAQLQQADQVAHALVHQQQQQALGQVADFQLSPLRRALRQRLLLQQGWPAAAPAVDPDNAAPAEAADGPLLLSLPLALEIAAGYSRDYQLQKEQLFQTALALDLEQERFRTSWRGLLGSLWSQERGQSPTLEGLHHSGDLALTRQLRQGASLAMGLALDLVQLLSGDRLVSRGLVADASISVPLLRGAGQAVVTEPLQQAERDLLYGLWSFDRYRRSFAVAVASSYLQVLERNNQVRTAYDNYQRLIDSRRRARRLADAGRLPEVQVDQALQDELRARSRWVQARQNSLDALDRFKLQLGLPTDAQLALDDAELARLQQSLAAALTDRADDGAAEQALLRLALRQRRDLLVARGQVEDARRGIGVAEDALRAELTLLGQAQAGESRSLGQAGQDDARLRPARGQYSALLQLDLALERTAERNALRNRWIELQQAVRAVEALEDNVKYEVRSAWRRLHEARETITIEQQAVRVARRRVASTSLFLRAGRIQMRDALEAEDALVAANNALVAAQVQYAIARMQLQRDLDVLEPDTAGQWLLADWRPPQEQP
ncbi:MAG: TolC family protein [Desulfuromonas thiophila]|nr:TolC family protein [Desulfuromonas thiophila]